jgi:2,4-dienoyl-CoA reductase-like NADH-dependent reductase (Old Yellow Enzyme family)
MVRLAPHFAPEVIDTGGKVTPAVAEHYARRARAGTGMIIVEATAVDPVGRVWPGGLLAFSDDQIPDLARLAEAIHSGGAVAAIQIVHGGPQATPSVSGHPTVGPSPVKPSHDAPLPRELTIQEILDIEQRFASAAARAAKAGFDIVEIHGAHGYLLDSFLLKSRNQRRDAYGGPLANRMRMLIETLHRVRERIGDKVLLDCRFCLFNKTNEPFTPDDLRELLAGLQSTGLDMLHISTDGALRPYFGTDRTLSQWIKQLTPLPLIVAGGLGSPHDANRLITDSHGDFAAIGSAFLRDPDWPQTARAELRA